MKTTVCIYTCLLILIIHVGVYSQANTDTLYTYCELVGTQRTWGAHAKMTVTVDFGEENRDKVPGKGKQTENVRSFDSMAGAMNQLSNEGWVFVQAYTVTIDQFVRVYWVLRKRK